MGTKGTASANSTKLRAKGSHKGPRSNRELRDCQDGSAAGSEYESVGDHFIAEYELTLHRIQFLACQKCEVEQGARNQVIDEREDYKRWYCVE